MFVIIFLFGKGNILVLLLKYQGCLLEINMLQIAERTKHYAKMKHLVRRSVNVILKIVAKQQLYNMFENWNRFCKKYYKFIKHLFVSFDFWLYFC